MNLQVTAVLTTVDYHGNVRTNGGDPISVEVSRVDSESSETPPIETVITDREDGSYYIKFRPPKAGRYV